MLVRRERPTDHDAVHALLRAAMAHAATPDGRPASDGSAEATLVDELREDGDLVPELTLVAEREGLVVGHLAMSRATLDGRAGEVVGLGPIGVLPDQQGRGVGSALMHVALAAADALGLRGVVLLGHPTYYPRFGFEAAVDHGVRRRRTGAASTSCSGASRPGATAPPEASVTRRRSSDSAEGGVSRHAPRGKRWTEADPLEERMRLPESRSLWMDTAPAPDRSGATLPAAAEVVVLGAGIAGLTAACRLAEAGRDVLLLDAGQVAAGVSGNTTAKVTAQHGLRYDRLVRNKDLAGAAEYAAAQLEALEWIADGVESGTVDCSFQRVSMWIYSTRREDRESYAKEAEACRRVGLTATLLTETPLPFPVAAAVRVDGQAQFHPRRWLLHLAERVEAAGGRIVEQCRATRVDGDTVGTTRGTVRGRDVVVATHFPILDRAGFFARLEPIRDLVVSGPVDPARAPDGAFLCTSESRSVRTVPRDDGSTDLIVGGENYRVGSRTDVLERHATLASWAQEYFGVTSLTHRWSAHDLVTPDGMMYAGRYHPATDHLWVATGFNLWGMTGGTAAGLLVANLVEDRADTERAALFNPSRADIDQVPGLVKDNAVVARHLVGDMASAATRQLAFAELGPGESRVGRVGSRLVAAHRDAAGALHAVDARCTHLGCTVAFNDAEQSWDCPCHGSRYALDGSVLHGPAVEPLAPVDEAVPTQT